MPRLKKAVEKKKSQRRAHLGQSQRSSDFVEPVRRLLMLRIAAEIERRQWTQVQTAKFFGVSQPRVSDLMRGLTANFTIDSLVQWVGLLGIDLQIDTKTGGITESVYDWLDESEKAIPYYTKLIATHPLDSESYWKRAYAYHQRGQYDLAIGDYARAMELDSSLQYLRINRAQSYLCLGQNGAALLDCDQLLAQNPEPALLSWAHITKASVYQALSSFEEALSEYQKAIAAAPEFPPAYFHRGKLHEWMKRYKDALKDFSRVLDFEPNNSEAQKHCWELRKKCGEKADDE